MESEVIPDSQKHYSVTKSRRFTGK